MFIILRCNLSLSTCKNSCKSLVVPCGEGSVSTENDVPQGDGDSMVNEDDNCSCISCCPPPIPRCLSVLWAWIKAILILAALKTIFGMSVYGYDIVSK